MYERACEADVLKKHGAYKCAVCRSDNLAASFNGDYSLIGCQVCGTRGAFANGEKLQCLIVAWNATQYAITLKGEGGG